MFGEGDMTEGGVVGAALNENGEAVNNNDEGGLENGKSDTSVSPAGLALFSSEGKEAPGGDVVSRMGGADGANSSHLAFQRGFTLAGPKIRILLTNQSGKSRKLGCFSVMVHTRLLYLLVNKSV